MATSTCARAASVTCSALWTPSVRSFCTGRIRQRRLATCRHLASSRPELPLKASPHLRLPTHSTYFQRSRQRCREPSSFVGRRADPAWRKQAKFDRPNGAASGGGDSPSHSVSARLAHAKINTKGESPERVVGYGQAR